MYGFLVEVLEVMNCWQATKGLNTTVLKVSNLKDMSIVKKQEIHWEMSFETK